MWLDLEHLAQRLFPQDEIVRVRYFTAMVRDHAKWEARQRAYHEALLARSPEVIDIKLGYFEERKRVCHRCGGESRMWAEKETDMNIGISMIKDAIWTAAEVFVVISGDGDLRAAVRECRAIDPDREFVVVFPPCRKSRGLGEAADRSFTINENHLRQAQLPPVLLDAQGHPIHRPESWK